MQKTPPPPLKADLEKIYKHIFLGDIMVVTLTNLKDNHES